MNALSRSLDGWALLDPWLLLLLALIPLALWLRRRRPDPAIAFSPGAAFFRDLPSTWRLRFRFVVPTLQVGGMFLAGLALARPVVREELAKMNEGIDIALCLDLSSSMSAKDMDARRTRLDLAKQQAARFIEGRPNDRIGLVSFARYPDLRCPPTLDHAALRDLLSELRVVASDGPEDATAIGTAVARAAQLLRNEETRSKVIILLTDGEENVASAQSPQEIAPLHAGQLCRLFQIRVYGIAAGAGNMRRAPSEPNQVKTLAEMSGGQFFEAQDSGALARVYAEIGSLEKGAKEQVQFRFREMFLPFLLAAVFFLIASRTLEATIFRVLP